MEVRYYGCHEHPGHYMFVPGMRNDYKFLYNNPWGVQVDTGLCPGGLEIEGNALLHHKDGWTALAFWDRSVDKRGKSNSVFLAEGTFDFERMIDLAKEFFPEVMERIKFPIVEAPKGRTDFWA